MCNPTLRCNYAELIDLVRFLAAVAAVRRCWQCRINVGAPSAHREENVTNLKMIAVAVGTVLLLVQTASAQDKKLTYKQAYAQCKQELDRGGVFGVNADAKARYVQGAGCMQKHGFRLKKKATF
jgi:hypothetical protein